MISICMVIACKDGAKSRDFQDHAEGSPSAMLVCLPCAICKTRAKRVG